MTNAFKITSISFTPKLHKIADNQRKRKEKKRKSVVTLTRHILELVREEEDRFTPKNRQSKLDVLSLDFLGLEVFYKFTAGAHNGFLNGLPVYEDDEIEIIEIISPSGDSLMEVYENDGFAANFEQRIKDLHHEANCED
jgi:hypothetical protein